MKQTHEPDPTKANAAIVETLVATMTANPYIGAEFLTHALSQAIAKYAATHERDTRKSLLQDAEAIEEFAFTLET
jgi:hypothetical protein